MLSDFLRSVCSRCRSVVCFLFRPWIWPLVLIRATGTKILGTHAAATHTPQVEVRHLGPESNLEFPAATDDQYHQIRQSFIESIDLGLICALASRHNNGKSCQVVNKASGSFNVCFFVDFDDDSDEGTKWVVRVPIEPAFDDPWDKLLSEVTTMQYLERNTRIPVPHIHAYGRDVKLTKGSTGTQMFIITDLVPGQPLNRKLLLGGNEEQRSDFLSQLIDVLAELRRLEFPAIGSLRPNASGNSYPDLGHVGPVISMSAAMLSQPSWRTVASATLRQTHRGPFTSAEDYLRYHFGLISDMFSLPVCDHTIEDVKEEIFALNSMDRISLQVIDPRLDKGPFVLHHLDLRSANIIVDDNLRIQGIIDWEFTSTVPRQLFTPPSWITGHDLDETNEQLHTEFRAALDEKSETDGLCDQLRREWYGQSDSNTDEERGKMDMAFWVAHVLRRPTDITDIFCNFIAQKQSDKPVDELISEFFKQNLALALEVQVRAEQCERYTEYLKRNRLYETDVDRLLAESRALKAKWGWS
ncbi:kinase-like protein [Sodiomyces alkalinus F11]|uniref:Kinase-like protein n=1 Tax=Sodiomyces alkalinus (strain CBS 110278 / VKM F-3762 / F11) TaxID=1314773 RepID=A0A3N2PJ27_SODAK|nr:kinase-like protein [Sodiomyces alkalinus F11]ROT34542.1 kinase-like protein [Sodiomyces alkalinus F11]